MEAQNQWRPVTEVYQQIIDPAQGTQFDADPMSLVNAARQARRMAEGKVPLGITIITAIYFLRAAVYGLFAARLLAPTDSEAGLWIVSRCPALIPFSLSTVDHKTLPTIMAEVLGVMAVLSLGIGLMWLFRWIPVLFISLGFSGFVLAHFAVSYFNVAGLGDPSLFGGTQLDLIVFEGALNVLIFFYIVLYPNLKQAFKR